MAKESKIQDLLTDSDLKSGLDKTIELLQALRDFTPAEESEEEESEVHLPFARMTYKKSYTKDGIPRRVLPFGKRLSVEFLDSVLWIEKDLGLNAAYLLACMAFETGQRFTSDVKNPQSTATGLIQFMEFTAKRLGTSTAELAQMSEVEQLGWVWKYFRDFGDDLSGWNLNDTYMAILWPAGIGKAEHHPIFIKGRGRTYGVNRGLDRNKDGRVTVGEAAAKVRSQLAIGKQAENLGYADMKVDKAGTVFEPAVG